MKWIRFLCCNYFTNMNGFEKTGHRVLTHTGFVFKPVYIKQPCIAVITTAVKLPLCGIQSAQLFVPHCVAAKTSVARMLL
jgi:hypothetical protein